MNIAFPFHFDSRGRTGDSDENKHIRDLIEQLLFTAPGERVNRPTFGSGVLNLVFAGNGPELAAATQFQIQGALQQWLGELIELRGVEVQNVDAQLQVIVRYVNRRTGEPHAEKFDGGAA